jgi:hypothetical protein
MSLLKTIQEGDDHPTVNKVDRGEFAISSPGSSRRADALKLKAKAANRGKVGMRWSNT